MQKQHFYIYSATICISGGIFILLEKNIRIWITDTFSWQKLIFLVPWPVEVIARSGNSLTFSSLQQIVT